MKCTVRMQKTHALIGRCDEVYCALGRHPALPERAPAPVPPAPRRDLPHQRPAPPRGYPGLSTAGRVPRAVQGGDAGLGWLGGVGCTRLASLVSPVLYIHLRPLLLVTTPVCVFSRGVHTRPAIEY